MRNRLDVVSGGTTIELQLDPAQDFTGKGFHLAPDGAGGTNVLMCRYTGTRIATPGRDVAVERLTPGALVNGISIIRDTSVPGMFTYWHIELDEHAILLAEGLPAESLLDAAGMVAFDNAAGRPALPGGYAELPYPRVKSARQLPLHMRPARAA